ncbi:hypothetical protein BGZ74_006678 [Mortierella antarctica]|nr:hypothetical protein BGZ74_006678 [Mortierella antarctica]KAG0349040.1 hypothetical protein BG005_011215 [Podila minutissima]
MTRTFTTALTMYYVRGGNQRDKDREKAQKKLAQQNKGKKTEGISHTKRAESDAEIMRAKQAAKEAAKTGGGSASK